MKRLVHVDTRRICRRLSRMQRLLATILTIVSGHDHRARILGDKVSAPVMDCVRVVARLGACVPTHAG